MSQLKRSLWCAADQGMTMIAVISYAPCAMPSRSVGGGRLFKGGILHFAISKLNILEMSKVSEITAAIRLLPLDERWNLLHEFADELWSDWDSQIEADLNSGKLDDFITQARADIGAARIRPLDEVIRNP